jgi:hypothetical protein
MISYSGFYYRKVSIFSLGEVLLVCLAGWGPDYYDVSQDGPMLGDLGSVAWLLSLASVCGYLVWVVNYI